MKQFTISDRRFVAVEVPKGAKDISVNNNRISWKLNPLKFFWDQKVIKPGSYKLIGLASVISEEGWKAIVEDANAFAKIKRYKDYEFVESGFYSARLSGYSLIKSLSLDPDTTVLLEKIK